MVRVNIMIVAVASKFPKSLCASELPRGSTPSSSGSISTTDWTPQYRSVVARNPARTHERGASAIALYNQNKSVNVAL